MIAAAADSSESTATSAALSDVVTESAPAWFGLLSLSRQGGAATEVTLVHAADAIAHVNRARAARAPQRS